MAPAMGADADSMCVSLLPAGLMFGISALGQSVLAELEQAGVSIEDIKICRRAVEVQSDRAAREAEPSRASFIAGHGASFAESVLPSRGLWYTLMVGKYRTMESLRSAQRTCAQFAQAQLALLRSHKQATSHLFPVDGVDDEMDMYRVIQSWEHLDLDTFDAVLRLMIHTGHVGSSGSINTIKYHVGNLVQTYHAAAGSGLALEAADPFRRHSTVIDNVRMWIKSSPLGTVRKMATLSTAQIGEVVKDTFIGGLGMLQGRFLFGHIALTGTRTRHFTFLRWKDVKLIKVFYLEAGVRKVGYALVCVSQCDKAPNSYGVKTIALDCLGMDQDGLVPLVGNMLVELGLAMGVYTPAMLRSLVNGDTLLPAADKREWYVICVEHDLLFNPFANASSSRISALLGSVAAVCGVYAGPRSLRSSMVLNAVLGTLLLGKPFDPTHLNHRGHWVFGPNNAALSKYFTSQGSAARFALITQAGNCASEAAQERARLLSRIGADSAGGGRAAQRRCLIENDLSAFVAFQGSAAGRVAQQRVTAAGRTLMEAVGGFDRGSGGPIANVFERLADLHPRPGLWLLRSPLADAYLQDLAGTRSGAVLAAYTSVVCAAQATRAQWLASAALVVHISPQDVSLYRAAVTGRDMRQMVADVEADHPEGLHVEEGGAGAGDASDGDGNDGDDLPPLPLAAGDGEYDGLGLEIAVDGDDLECAAAIEEAGGSGLIAAEAGGGAIAAQEDGDPPPGEGRLMTAMGNSVNIPVTHRAGLAMLRARRRLVHLLTTDSRTGRSWVPFPACRRIPQAHPDFTSDVVDLGHDDCEALLRTYISVRDGLVPRAAARFAHMTPAMRNVLHSGICLVRDCASHATLGSYKALHICDGHRQGDIEIESTGELMRPCSACKMLLL
eukprot:jgi/Ulvmu1/8195/UM041_0003.1